MNINDLKNNGLEGLGYLLGMVDDSLGVSKESLKEKTNEKPQPKPTTLEECKDRKELKEFVLLEDDEIKQRLDSNKRLERSMEMNMRGRLF